VNKIENNHDLIIVLGTIPSIDNQELCDTLLAKAQNGSDIVLFSTMEDRKLNNHLKLFCKYEVSSEEGLLAIFSKYLLQESSLPQELSAYFDALDEGYLSAETNIGEEEFEEVAELYNTSKSPLFIIGEDLVSHPRVENIKIFLSILDKFTKATLVSLAQESILGEIKTLQEIEELQSFDGTVVMESKALDSDQTNLLIGSAQFAVAAKSQNNQEVVVSFGDTVQNRKFVVDEELKGTIALMPVMKAHSSYRYKVAKITKREVQ